MMKLIDGAPIAGSTISNRSGSSRPPQANKFVMIGANGVPQAVPYIPTTMANGAAYLESANPKQSFSAQGQQ